MDPFEAPCGVNGMWYGRMWVYWLKVVGSGNSASVFILVDGRCLIRGGDHGNEGGGSDREEVAVVGIGLDLQFIVPLQPHDLIHPLRLPTTPFFSSLYSLDELKINNNAPPNVYHRGLIGRCISQRDEGLPFPSGGSPGLQRPSGASLQEYTSIRCGVYTSFPSLQMFELPIESARLRGNAHLKVFCTTDLCEDSGV